MVPDHYAHANDKAAAYAYYKHRLLQELCEHIAEHTDFISDDDLTPGNVITKDCLFFPNTDDVINTLKDTTHKLIQ